MTSAPFGLTPELLFEALIIGLVCCSLAWRRLALPWAVFVSVLKIMIPLGYFAWFYDGQWNFLDDFNYKNVATEWLEAGYNPINALFPEAIIALQARAESTGWLYYWWNLLAQYLFGPYYYTPIFLNVLLTFFNANVVAYLAAEYGFKKQYCNGLYLFLLVHWELLAWSSLINQKDILYMTLTMVALLLLHQLSQKITVSRLVWLALVFICMLLIRVQMVALLLVAYSIWFVLKRNNKQVSWYITLTLIIAYFLFPFDLITSGRIQLNELGYGSVHFFLTPQPWSVDSATSFLILPASLHFVFTPIVLLMGWRLWYTNPAWRLPLIYLVVTIVAYAVVPSDRGVRQRIQITAIIAWLQFHFLWLLVRQKILLTSRQLSNPPTT